MSDKIGLTTKIKQDVIKILKRAFTIAKEKKLTPCDREREWSNLYKALDMLTLSAMLWKQLKR